MRRRALLATAAGGLAALAGCLDAGTDGTDGSTPTGGSSPADEPTPTDPTPTDGGTPTGGSTPAGDVTVERVRLQYGVVTPTSPDSIGVSNPTTPYLLAWARIDGPVARDDFALAVGDERYAPATADRLYRTAWGDDRWYRRERTGGLLLFEPSGGPPGGDLRLTWPGGEHPVDGSIRERLGAGPPRLSAALDLPATHAGIEAPPVRIEVTNGGETPARFVGALNRTGPRVAYSPVAAPTELAAPGETVTITVPDDWSGLPGDERIGDGDPDVIYRLGYGGGEDTAKIRLVEGP